MHSGTSRTAIKAVLRMLVAAGAFTAIQTAGVATAQQCQMVNSYCDENIICGYGYQNPGSILEYYCQDGFSWWIEYRSNGCCMWARPEA